MTPLAWLGILAILLVIEAITVGLTTVWFAGGALVACIASWLGGGIVVQLLLFFGVSVVLLIFTRPLAVRYMNKGVEKTNAESLLGKRAVVIQPVNNLAQTGQVRINDIEWTARTADDGEEIPTGAVVEIEEIRGVKLIVKELSKEGYIMGGVVVLLVVIVLVLWVLASCIRIVPQAYAVVLERLGAYKATWSTGIHFKVPFIERVARRVNLKEQVVDFPPQPVITKDNVTMQIDTVVFFQITDPKLYAYGVENPIMAIENLSATTLRNIIGDMELDETLTSREVINTKMRASLDVATDPWGIKVNRVELKNIIPPAAIQDAMEKQMKAERERREAILKAEGEKRSTILVAEGKKQSAILDAEAEKQAAILHAEAQKERMIKEAEGQAQAVLKVQQATAEGLRMIKEAGADESVLTLKSLEALTKVADGKATKIIIPSEIQGIAGLATSLKEIMTDKPAEQK